MFKSMRARFPVPGRVFLLLALATTTVPTQAARAQDPPPIRGFVRAPDGTPIQGALVTIVPRDTAPLPARTTRTDDHGAFSIPGVAGAASYRVSVTVVGFAPQTKQVTATDAQAALDFKLTQAVQQLAPVTTMAQRQRPTRSDREGTGAGEAGSATVAGGGLTGDLTGDLTAAMATIPGLLITPDATGGLPTISAFGLSADQNALTLNGMNFGAGSIPRDGLTVRVAQSTYDPGRGGFSGVQTSLRLPSGGNMLNQIVHLTHEDPSLQGNPPAAAALGTQYSRQIVSGSWSGPIIEDKAFYNTSFQFTRRASDLPSITGIDAATLQSLGINADSVARLKSVVGSLSIPLATVAVPSQRLSTNASGLMRLDWSPNATNRSGNVTYLLVGGNWADNAGTRSSATALPSHGGDARTWAAQTQANAARYLGPVLNESNLSFVTTSNRSTPYLALPDARVLVGSNFADGTAASTTVRVGGNSGGESRTRGTSIQGRNETTWFTWDNRHQFKVTLDGRMERDNTTQSPNSLGTFSYNSLADLAAGTPTSFTRALGVRETQGRQLLGAVGLGDAFRKSQQLRLQYGVRIEGNRFGGRPSVNPALVAAFTRSTDVVPAAITIAPMIGFTRSYTGAHGGSFSGGIREYSGTLSSQTVENVSRFTGLPDAIKQLVCVGSAVPTPRWSSYAGTTDSIPQQCQNGASVFNQSTPVVSLFAPDYQPSKRWGASLTWTGRVSQRWIGWVTTNYSLNLHRPGTVDLNFDPTPKFTLSAEGSRPVFVPQSSIVSSTGAVAATGSRLHSEFAAVNELRSDLRSDAKQLVLGFAPVQSSRPAGFAVTTSFRAYYTLSLNRDQSRGFGGTTAGDPRAVVWESSGLPRHAFQLLGSIQIPKWVNIDAFARIASGRRYTPMVGGDINGDGLANDRAFIFSTASADPRTAAGMQALLASAPAAAQRCLRQQSGLVAARNTCDGPWTQGLNLAIGPDPTRFGFGGRGSISLVITNALAAADQLFHGSNHLRYWGTSAAPDATLLNIRGFNPATNAFVYDVNPSFGSTTASRSTGRVPFVISLDVRWRLGPDRDAQMLKGFLKPRPADGTPVLDASQIKDRLDKDAQNNFEDIAGRKALRLDDTQIILLKSLAGRFDKYRDSVYTGLSKYLASLRGNYLTAAAKKRFHDDFVAIAHLYVIAGPSVRALLSSEQYGALQGDVTAYFDMDEATFQRLMRGADFGALLELITGEGVD